MSSPSTGPFKSRFLNFLNRQVLHVSDRVEKSVRKIRVAAEWGAQILLYPVYLFVQTGRMAGHQLHQTVERGKLPDASQDEPQQLPTTDKPIQQVLAAISSQKDGETSLTQSSSSSQCPMTALLSRTQVPAPRLPHAPCPIQGIASLLEQRRLVLVTTDNQILDILTQDQQRQLRQRITWEVADYWYCRRLAHSTKNAGRLPTFNKNNRVLAPVRWFWRTMSWVQASPVALSLNLFGELSVVRFVTAYPETPVRTQYRLAGILPSSEQPLVAAQEAQTQRWFPFSHLRNSTTDVKPDRIGSLIRAAIDYFFGDRQQASLNRDRQTAALSSPPPSEATPHLSGDTLIAETHQLPATAHKKKFLPGNWFNTAIEWVPSTQITQTLGDRLSHLRQKLQSRFGSSLDSPDGTEPNPFQIGALIRAAIDYYFGYPQPSRTLSGDRAAIASSQPPTQQASEDFWLSWNDLFETPQTHQESDDQQEDSRLPQLGQALPKPEPLSPLGRIKRYLHLPSHKNNSLLVSPTSAQKDSEHTQKVAPLQDSVSALAQPPAKLAKAQSCDASESSASTATAIAPSSHLDPSLKLDPDWIDANATTVGYVKHPLEKLLDWLDRTLLWLEDLMARLWRWLFKKAPKSD